MIFAGQRADLLGHRDRLLRVLPELRAVVEQRCAELAREAERFGEGLHEIGERIVTGGAALLLRRRRRERRRTTGSHVGHRQQYLHERDSVGIAVMDAHDHRAAAAVILDHVELPARPRRIERRRRKAADERLQLALAGRPRKRHVNHVVIEIEVGGGLPERAGRRFNGTLKETTEPDEPLGNHGAQRIDGHRLREREHGADHHQVARTIHPQPRGVHR